MTILLAFPSSAMSFFLIFVLLELDSELSTRNLKILCMFLNHALIDNMFLSPAVIK